MTTPLRGLAVPSSFDLVQDLLVLVRSEHPDISETDLSMFETAIAEIHGNVVKHGRPEGIVVRLLAERAARSPGRLPSRHGRTRDRPLRSDRPPVDEMAESGRGLWLAHATLDELLYARPATGTRGR